jgi:phosphatidylglycerophosphate synthase
MSQPALQLSRWSTVNAVALLAAFALAAAMHEPWPVAVVGLGSFASLIARARGAWTPRGVFGWANVITSVRLLLVLALAAGAHRAAGEFWAASGLVIFGLDWLDGWLARRAALDGPFGAHFDMETDALLVLVLCLELWQRGRFASWILTSGLLRYAYVCSMAFLPPRSGEMPRTWLGRYGFAILIGGLCSGLLFSGPLGTASAALGTLAVVLSFARSFHWSYARSSAS